MSLEDLIKERQDDQQKFDLVCCSEVIEHVQNQKEFIKKIAEVTKPGGYIFISSIAKTPEAYISAILMGEYVLGLLPKGTHEYEYLISHDTVANYLKEVNCHVVAQTGATILNPITREMGEIPFMRANYLLMIKKNNNK